MGELLQGQLGEVGATECTGFAAVVLLGPALDVVEVVDEAGKFDKLVSRLEIYQADAAVLSLDGFDYLVFDLGPAQIVFLRASEIDADAGGEDDESDEDQQHQNGLESYQDQESECHENGVEGYDCRREKGGYQEYGELGDDHPVVVGFGDVDVDREAVVQGVVEEEECVDRGGVRADKSELPLGGDLELDLAPE